ncbi:MAG: hypothetical protein E5V85_15750 [Mesorhizobium sp.]|nr:MAG: hypothetical protein E5V85_15750 [Mesorhizobium sp.]
MKKSPALPVSPFSPSLHGEKAGRRMRGSAMLSRKLLRRTAIAGISLACLAAASVAALWELDRAFPPPTRKRGLEMI